MAIPNWENNKTYKQYDIIEQPDNSGLFYYATIDHSSLLDPQSSSGSSGSSVSSGSSGSSGTFYSDKVKWAGIVEINGEKVPHFFWRPDYNVKYEVRAEVNKTQYGDGYEQRSKANMDNILLNFGLTFSNRSAKEATAILHFLNQRRGYQQFLYFSSGPYASYSTSLSKRFICKSWKHSHVFDNNNRISCQFEEVPVNGKFEVIR